MSNLAPEPGTPLPGETPAVSPGTAKPFLRITMGGRSLDVHTSQLGPVDDAEARQQTGGPLSPMFEPGYVFGSDTLIALWWFARRRHGEPRLRYRDVVAEFPTVASIYAAEPDITQIDPATETDALVDEVGADPEA